METISHLRSSVRRTAPVPRCGHFSSTRLTRASLSHAWALLANPRQCRTWSSGRLRPSAVAPNRACTVSARAAFASSSRRSSPSGSACGRARPSRRSVRRRWTMTAVSESFTVQEWSAPCGPAPVVAARCGRQPGDRDRRRGRAPDQRRTRTLRTDQCLDPMPTLARERPHAGRAARGARAARRRRATRARVVNTAYFVPRATTPSRSPRRGATSSPSTRRTASPTSDAERRSRGRSSRAAERRPRRTRIASRGDRPCRAPPTATAAPPIPTAATPVPKVDCSVPPGDPARLEVRPSRKLLKHGRHVRFRAVVLDAAAARRGRRSSGRWGRSPSRTGRRTRACPRSTRTGKLTIPPPTSPTSRSTSSRRPRGRSARASVQVTSPANYEALLAQSGLGPTGERDDAGGRRPRDELHRRRRARRRRTARASGASLSSGSSAGCAGCCSVVAVVGARARARRAAPRPRPRRATPRRCATSSDRRPSARRRHAAQMKAHLESVAIAQQQAAAAAARGVRHGADVLPVVPAGVPGRHRVLPVRLEPPRRASRATRPSWRAPGGICPTCHRGFNPGVKVCPHDGDELVPAPVAAAGPRPPAAPPGARSAPTCGEPLRRDVRLLRQGRHRSSCSSTRGGRRLALSRAVPWKSGRSRRRSQPRTRGDCSAGASLSTQKRT